MYFFKLLIFKVILFVYLLMAVLGKPGLLSGCGARASPCADFSCGAWPLGRVSFSDCGPEAQALELGLNSCGTWP